MHNLLQRAPRRRVRTGGAGAAQAAAAGRQWDRRGVLDQGVHHAAVLLILAHAVRHLLAPEPLLALLPLALLGRLGHLRGLRLAARRAGLSDRRLHDAQLLRHRRGGVVGPDGLYLTLLQRGVALDELPLVLGGVIDAQVQEVLRQVRFLDLATVVLLQPGVHPVWRHWRQGDVDLPIHVPRHGRRVAGAAARLPLGRPR
mmetsp:Transcript_34376/g.102114  ORF Transcript_34376/g.102114 Transcript_34376/m.102114 type:complete len:200 (-) Transcript_34376:17-616(-)